MEDFASNLLTLPPPYNVVVIIFALIVVSSVLQALIEAVRAYADHRAEERFKVELIENGLAFEEAERWTRLSVARKRKRSSRCSREATTVAAEDPDTSHVLA